MRLCTLFLLVALDMQAWASTYYLSPTGSDSAAGTVSAPWLSPNHALNCGDVILASPGAYNSANFQSWGTVSCPANNNVAWLECATFAACSITATSQSAMSINKSYWGVEGWVATATPAATYGACFKAYPTGSTTIHHIIFANNIANGCQDNGFTSTNNGATSSVDYLVIIGNIVYNAAQSSTECYSGISINQPMQSDSAAGTHIFVAGNFSYGNYDPSNCPSGDTDGEGLIFDSFENQLSGAAPYGGQTLAENNMLIGNGGRGLSVVDNQKTPHAAIYLKNNTIWKNNLDTHQSGSWCGELYLQNDSGVIATGNLIATGTATGCGANPTYSMAVGGSDGTNTISGNFAYSMNGSSPLSASNTGFVYGTNLLGVNPDFTNASVPAAPSCGTYSGVPACMATVVSNMTAQAASASGYGYQIPSATPVYDALFPQWLCNVALPVGLVTSGCASTVVPPVTPPATVLPSGTYTLSPGTTVVIQSGTITIK